MTRLRPALFALALALAGAAVTAQEEPAPQPPAGEEAAADDSPKTTGNGPADSPPVSPQARPGGDSPYDYRSSEEISEDLPVSFPVDI